MPHLITGLRRKQRGQKVEPKYPAPTRFGGKPEEYPKPWILLYGTNGFAKRPINIKSTVWAIGEMGNGHHHADIREEDNRIWVDSDGEGCWGQPWGYRALEEFEELRGRWDMNCEFVKRDDVIKWAKSILEQWGITEETYEVIWEVDEDDPLASSVLASEMRKREERGD